MEGEGERKFGKDASREIEEQGCGGIELEKPKDYKTGENSSERSERRKRKEGNRERERDPAAKMWMRAK